MANCDDSAHPMLQGSYLGCRDSRMYDGIGFPTYTVHVSEKVKYLAFPSLLVEKSAACLQARSCFGVLGETLNTHCHTVSEGQPTKFGQFTQIDGVDRFVRQSLKSALYKVVLDTSLTKEQARPAFATLCAFPPFSWTLSYTFRIETPNRTQPWIPFKTLLLHAHGTSRGPFQDRLSFYHPLGWRHADLNRAPGTSWRSNPPSPKEDAFVPRHTRQDCLCDNASIAVDRMERAAAAGKVVLCRFTAEPNKPRALEVKEVDITSSDLPLFYAISHAKIAGLGSTIDNSIPSCQAAAMQSLVDQAEGEGSVPGSRFFWIDTLGVPLNKALGKQALCKVWDVFSRAKMTLVLDPEMQQRASTTYEECLERIGVSVWKSRMWTPKEGFVSQNLVIRFLDRMISLDEALRRVDARQTRAPPDVMLQKHDPNDAGPLGGTLSVPTRALTIMRCFEDDIAAWMMEANPAALLLSIKSDKMQLYKLSRLGYLAAPRLWYFAEDDESADSIRAWEILERVYAGVQDAASIAAA